jgi:hypothetical protein
MMNVIEIRERVSRTDSGRVQMRDLRKGKVKENQGRPLS